MTDVQREPIDATVLICTYDRAALLAETLDSLAAHASRLRWDVLVVDNNSADKTRRIVEERARDFPVPLRYLFEPRQGKSYALNTGLAAIDARTVVFTDDDVRIQDGWLDAACAPLLAGEADYTGGPVFPIWGAPRPTWLSAARADLWGTIAIIDYGPDPFVFEARRRIPIGANMAVTRDLLERIGGFNPALGRTGRSLLGQEQAEFFCRSRAVGARGQYVPAMAIEHHVPAGRLTRRYFRRWWFWKGIARVRLQQMQRVTELGIDLDTTPHVAGIPRFMIGCAARDSLRWLSALVRRDATARFRHEMMITFFAGYAWGVARGEARAIAHSAPAPPGGRGSRDAASTAAPSTSSALTGELRAPRS
jgi:glycosyltransferase involved in cell wall biosynthesis